MGKSKWLVSLFYDGQTPNKPTIEQMLQRDITAYKTHSTKEFPNEPEVVFKWIDVNLIVPPSPLPSDKVDRYVDETINSRIRGEFIKQAGYTDLTLLLDRDLFVQKNAANLFLSLVKHPFFRPSREPNHYICCFGGVNGIMRSSAPSPKGTICATNLRSCSICPLNNQKIMLCNHTCYWRLIGLMLGAYPEPCQSKNRQIDKGILQALPKTYIY